MTRRRIVFLTSIAACSFIASICSVKSQSPEPIVVPAATVPSPTSALPVASSAAVPSPDAITIAIRTLEQIKTTNDEILKRQNATLQQLDEMQQAAEQLKIFAKRG